MSNNDKEYASNTIRINTWIHTLQLFHKYKKVGFTGPFYGSGYKDYRLEYGVNNSISGEEHVPDIITWDKKRKKLSIVDITNNPNEEKKRKQMSKYKDIDIESLSGYNVPMGIATLFDILLAIDKPHNTDEYCQLIVGDIFDVKSVEKIHDELLKENLQKTVNSSLSKLPQIKISILPEMKNELRSGLVGYVIKIFDPDSAGYSAKELADLGLGDFKKNFSPTSKKNLVRNITKHMNILLEKYLPEYLEYVDGKYRANIKDRKSPISASPKSKKAISDGIFKWAAFDKETHNNRTAQSNLDFFEESEEE